MSSKIESIKNKMKTLAVTALVLASGKSMAQGPNSTNNDRLENTVELSMAPSAADLVNSSKHTRLDKPLTEDYTSYLGRVKLHNTQCSVTEQGLEMISGTMEDGNTLVSIKDHTGTVKRTVLDSQGQKLQEEQTNKSQQTVTFFKNGKPVSGHSFDKTSNTYFDLYYDTKGKMKAYNMNLDPRVRKFDKHKSIQIAKNPNLKNAREF